MFSAKFIRKLNRFVGEVIFRNEKITVYIPNTGRVAELFIPGREVILVNNNGKYKYKMKFVIFHGKPVMIDSIYSNRIAGRLLEEKQITSLKNYQVVRKEPAYKNHRFDFLISRGEKESYLEIKSCTLGWENIASFPDAPTERGQKHLEALQESGKGKLVFLIFHQGIEFFVPNYHTDFDFHQKLSKVSGDVPIEAYSVNYNRDYEVESLSPVKVILPEINSRAGYGFLFYRVTSGEKENYLVCFIHNDEDIFKQIKKSRRDIEKKHKINNINHSFESIKYVNSATVVDSNLPEDYKDFFKKMILIEEIDEKTLLLEKNPLSYDLFWNWIFKKRYFKYVNNHK